MTDIEPVLRDLQDEGDALDQMVAGLSGAGWTGPTPAPGWTVAHQIAHLAWTDQIALLAATDPDAFATAIQAALSSIDSYVDEAAAAGARLAPDVLLDNWRRGRSALLTALRKTPPGAKLPWFGPPMGAASMATARLMETWAHGTDVASTLRLPNRPTARLRNVAHIAVRTRDFAFLLHDLPVPDNAFRIELTAPDGQLWTWGQLDSTQRVTGSALDFCLLATQRINRADTDLAATGEQAHRWLDIIQAFAGPPGAGRPSRGATQETAGGRT
ncbi:TIGR03084 family metal-binding protein [soil metagenome]